MNADELVFVPQGATYVGIDGSRHPNPEFINSGKEMVLYARLDTLGNVMVGDMEGRIGWNVHPDQVILKGGGGAA